MRSKSFETVPTALSRESSTPQSLEKSKSIISSFFKKPFDKARVCEIGPDREESLATDIYRRMGTSAQLTIISPLYKTAVNRSGKSPHLQQDSKEFPIAGKNVTRRAGEFPGVRLRRNFYDLMVGIWSITEYIQREKIHTFLSATSDALAQDGIGVFFPIQTDKFKPFLTVNMSEEQRQRVNYHAELVDIPYTDDMFPDRDLTELCLVVRKRNRTDI